MADAQITHMLERFCGGKSQNWEERVGSRTLSHDDGWAGAQLIATPWRAIVRQAMRSEFNLRAEPRPWSNNG